MNLRKLSFLNQEHIILRILIVILLSSTTKRENLCYSDSLAVQTLPPHSGSSIIHSSLQMLTLDGHLSFENTSHAAKDFGNRYHLLPSAVLHPRSVADISAVIKHIFQLGATSELTVAARGHGHSLEGQAQAYRGVVIHMESLPVPKMDFHYGHLPYVDVSGGELWINILQESLKHGLTPKSWTDYLHLTVGGTLSNAGISGQAFKQGRQIDNVYQLEVVTGTGEVVTCSEDQNMDLFYGVLGGLGQFGIITRARIALEPAPRKVRWIRMLYSDFLQFTSDQEHLISAHDSFDYLEGFVIINRTGLLNNWRSSFQQRDPVQASQFTSEGKTLYCLEIARYLYQENTDNTDQILLSNLNYIPSTLFQSEVSYVEFLDRVHFSEIKLREKGLWEIPHPWLNLLIPKNRIRDFSQEVFGKILTETSNGPILIYPVNKFKWKNSTSMVTPDEQVFYLVAFLSSALPSSRGKHGLEHILKQNRRIKNFCKRASLGVKQYLPHYTCQEEWKAHFGTQWETFARRKSAYDPLAILAPGQRIFSKRQHSIGNL